MTQPMPTMMPPKATTSFGPRCGPSMSTIQPSIGVSHVSSAMNMAKATWIEAIDQPCALLIGLTKSVQPYCRLAIITIQMMQNMRFIQRVDSDTRAVEPEPAAITIESSLGFQSISFWNFSIISLVDDAY